jgi:hypothetical protein
MTATSTVQKSRHVVFGGSGSEREVGWWSVSGAARSSRSGTLHSAFSLFLPLFHVLPSRLVPAGELVEPYPRFTIYPPLARSRAPVALELAAGASRDSSAWPPRLVGPFKLLDETVLSSSGSAQNATPWLR